MILSIPIEFEQFLSRSIWSIDGTLTVTTDSDLSGPGINGNDEVTSHSPELRNKGLIIGCSLISYSDNPFFT